MFDTKKTLIVVYKDELLVNQLKKLVETCDDTEQNIVGTRDNSINIVSWTEKVWLDNKKAGNIQGKVLFLGDVRGTNKLIPVIDVKFDDCGVKYGWAGNQAIVYADTKVLKERKDYDAFLEKFSDLPVPDFLKTAKEEIKDTGTCEEEDSMEETNENEGDEHVLKENVAEEIDTSIDEETEENEKNKRNLLKAAKGAIQAGANGIGEMGNRMAVKSEEIFRDKFLMKRQMLFYGVINLYNNGLEEFMNL